MLRRLKSARTLLVVVLLSASALAACTKPSPDITVYGNGKSIVIDAAFYSFTGSVGAPSIADATDARSISAQQGSKVLIDVPRSVANNTWLVSAFTFDTAGKANALAGAGGVGNVTGAHTTRITVPSASVTPEYYVEVVELRHGLAAGGWVFHVRVSS